MVDSMPNNSARDAEWRNDLRKNVKAKERTDKKRVHMNELDAQIRSGNYEEVNQGLTPEQAQNEAARCLDCANPTCIEGCPVSIDIPGFIKNIEVGLFLDAAKILKEKSSLPAVCGRVCPQEKQCEAHCIYTLKLKKEPVTSGHLERFGADFERNSGNMNIPQIPPKNGVKVAVAGSGPSGLSFAGEMAKKGYDVTVFEALHEIGGVLKYGIPEFRLPNSIVDAEIDILRKMGVHFIPNCIIGKTITLQNLQDEGYQSLFVASGAGLPRFMHINGENLVGVMSANEYLTRINLMGAGRSKTDTPIISGKNVAIIGGGNTAMDSVRTAKRLGAENAYIIYRRSFDEMPARAEELKHALEEGIEFKNLYNPVEYIGDKFGQLKQIKLQKMELGEPDASGRRRPIPVNKFELLDIDLAIVAIGVSPNPIIPNSIENLNTSSWGTIEVSEETMQSSIPYIFAGGDIVRGGATVILAMGDGKKAAQAMDNFLKSIVEN